VAGIAGPVPELVHSRDAGQIELPSSVHTSDIAHTWDITHTSDMRKKNPMTTHKVAVVTGASQGIGAALVSAYRKLGYAVVANSRSITPSDDPSVLTVAGDIADPSVGARVIERGLATFGRIDTLVNNAGVFVAKPFTDYTDEDYDLVTGVNLRGFFEVSKRAVAAMLTGGGGHIVNISTSLVDHADSNVPCALAALTKGGLNAVTRSLAIEYAARGIRVNAVSPGIVRTPMHPAETHEALARMHPLGRMGEISDIVDAITYLETAPFVTGEILHVDGGQSAGR
jgi:NAD(P)-dependent dehydrogenase (short-subunit alcohol dehydrogenase family)